MAWQYPTHACGHTGERYQAYGHHSGRERQLKVIESQDCPTCRRTLAEQASAAQGLPLIKGSDKQVAWAVEIRERCFRLHPEKLPLLQPEVAAKWWIDNRGSLQ